MSKGRFKTDESYKTQDRPANYWNCVAVSLFIVYDIISLGINTFVNTYIAYGTIWDSFVIIAVLAYFSARAIINQKQVKRKSVFVLLSIILIGVISISLHPSNMDFIDQTSYSLLLQGFLLFVLASGIDDLSSLYSYLEVLIIPSVICGAIQLFLSPQLSNLTDNLNVWMSDMTTAYALLPITLIAIDSAFHKRFMWIVALVASIIIVAYGSRGPVVVLLIFLVFSFIRYADNVKKKFIVFLAFAVSVYLLYSGTIINWLTALSNLLAGKNITIASIQKMLYYTDFFNGRESIYSTAMNAIGENYLLGSGIYSDRKFSVYSHNLVIELLVDFGIILGSFVIIWIVYNIIKKVYECSKQMNSKALTVFLAITFAIIGKLLFSSSYLNEPLFFMLLGMFTVGVVGKEVATDEFNTKM